MYPVFVAGVKDMLTDLCPANASAFLSPDGNRTASARMTTAFRTPSFARRTILPRAISGRFEMILSRRSQLPRGGPGCLNSFSASISGASAGVRLPSGGAAVCSRLDRASCRQGSSVDVGHCKSPGNGRWKHGPR